MGDTSVRCPAEFSKCYGHYTPQEEVRSKMTHERWCVVTTKGYGWSFRVSNEKKTVFCERERERGREPNGATTDATTESQLLLRWCSCSKSAPSIGIAIDKPGASPCRRSASQLALESVFISPTRRYICFPHLLHNSMGQRLSARQRHGSAAGNPPRTTEAASFDLVQPVSFDLLMLCSPSPNPLPSGGELVVLLFRDLFLTESEILMISFKFEHFCSTAYPSVELYGGFCFLFSLWPMIDTNIVTSRTFSTWFMRGAYFASSIFSYFRFK